MKTLHIILAALMLCTAMCFTACDGKTGDRDTPSASGAVTATELVGTWKGTGDELATVTFGADGKVKDETDLNGTIITIAGPYSVDTAEHTVFVHDDEDGLDFSYHYTVSGDDLTLQMDGGKARTFKKVK
ncbi:MAG: hypothetical protein J6I96_05770 [Oscillospiraceae bacterium]|nr:hypothetical protein [Oscillospiraceae bacterium]